MNSIPLIIWVNSPPFVERGALDYLAKQWPAKATYAVLGTLRPERAAMGWTEENTSDAMTLRPRHMSVQEYTKQILDKNPDAMHLIAGLTSVTGEALRQITERNPPTRVAVFSERPGVHGTLQRRILTTIGQPIKYRHIVRQYKSRVGLLLPLGRVAIERFARYGWPRETMRSFMYCPPIAGSLEPLPDLDRGVKFLYVGRMSHFAKGTDILLDAASKLQGSWSLTLVGGHGDYANQVKSRATKFDNVEYLGPASPRMVAKIMSEHHVSVVPSRVDGWNVVVGESLRVGRGVVATDRIASDELIVASGAGKVVSAHDSAALARAMQQVIDSPGLVAEWSRLGATYAPRISPEAAGQYLLDLLLCTMDEAPLPHSQPPWLVPSNGRSSD